MKVIKFILLLLASSNCLAIEVDRGQAAAYSITSIVTLFAFAFLAFKAITFGIDKSSPISPIKKGREFAAWVVGFLIFSSSNFYVEPNAEYFYRLSLIVIPLGLLAFLLGFFWFKYKTSSSPILESTANTGFKLNFQPLIKNQKIIIGLLVLALGAYLIFRVGGLPSPSLVPKKLVYKFYNCIGTNYEKDCQRELKGTATFKVDKEKSQVVVIYDRLKDNQKTMFKLDNCTVLDEKNWKCGGHAESNDFFSTVNAGWTSVDGEIYTTDLIMTKFVGGKPQSTIVPSPIFKRE